MPCGEGELADSGVPHDGEEGVDAEEEVGRLGPLDVDQRQDEPPLDVRAHQPLRGKGDDSLNVWKKCHDTTGLFWRSDSKVGLTWDRGVPWAGGKLQ